MCHSASFALVLVLSCILHLLFTEHGRCQIQYLIERRSLTQNPALSLARGLLASEAVLITCRGTHARASRLYLGLGIDKLLPLAHQLLGLRVAGRQEVGGEDGGQPGVAVDDLESRVTVSSSSIKHKTP